MERSLNSAAHWALRRLSYWLPIVAASVAVIGALFADEVGLGADAKWGEVRIITFVAGLVVLGLAAADRVLNALDQRLAKRREIEMEPASQQEQWSPTSRHMMVLALFLGTIAVYLGLVTVWKWPDWPASSYRFHSQAKAFANAEIALPVQPSPELAELANPYDPELRQGIEVVGDLSYYNGRYYMYWGPAPAALSALWLLAGGAPISDAVIVILSVSAIFLFSSLALLHLQRTYFPKAPPWLVVSGIILVAVGHPMLWTLNSPSIYTAAVSSGQAFFMGGLYFMITDLTQARSSPWRDLSCGALWAFALASRLTLLPAIALLTLSVVTFRFYRPRPDAASRPLYRAVYLVAPLVLGLLLLGAFNFARFDDPLQSGFAYQMVGWDQGEALRQGLVFNASYILPNLLYYLATPIRIVSEFPFVRPWWGSYPPFEYFLARLSIPQPHGVQNAAGLLLVTPALLLGGLLLVKVLSWGRERPCPLGDRRFPSSLTLRHLTVVLLLGGVALVVPSLLYRVSATRFLMEVTPLFALLSALGGFVLHRSSQGLPARRTVISLLIPSLVVVSSVIGFLLALNGADSRFDDANPALYNFLVQLFSW